jgi:hypothetical protein
VNQQVKKMGGKIRHPKLIGTLYGYRQGIARNLTGNLLALGLDKKPPPQKTLEQILAENADEDNESEAR